MEIKTKFNIGDTFWVMRDNRPTECHVMRIYVEVHVEPRDNYASKIIIFIRYHDNFGEGRPVIVHEESMFKTKDELLKSL